MTHSDYTIATLIWRLRHSMEALATASSLQEWANAPLPDPPWPVGRERWALQYAKARPWVAEAIERRIAEGW